MWLLIVAIFTFGSLYAREISIYISCHVCIMLLKIPWRTLALFAYRWYVMCFYLRNWGKSTNLEIVPHSGPYNMVPPLSNFCVFYFLSDLSSQVPRAFQFPFMNLTSKGYNTDVCA